MRRTPPPPMTRKKPPAPNRPKPVVLIEQVEVAPEENNPSPPQLNIETQLQQQVSNPTPQQTALPQLDQPLQNVTQQIKPVQSVRDPPVDQGQIQPQQYQETPILQTPITSEKTKKTPIPMPRPSKSKAPPPPTKTKIPKSTYTQPDVIAQVNTNQIASPEEKIEGTLEQVQATQPEPEKNQKPSKEEENPKSHQKTVSVPPKKNIPVPPNKSQKRGKSPQQESKPEIPKQVEPSPLPNLSQVEPLTTPQKSQQPHQKFVESNSISQVPPSGSNSKLYEKMLKLRQAKEQLAEDSDIGSDQDEEVPEEVEEEKVNENEKQQEDVIMQNTENKVRENIESEIPETTNIPIVSNAPEETFVKTRSPPVPPPVKSSAPARNPPKAAKRPQPPQSIHSQKPLVKQKIQEVKVEERKETIAAQTKRQDLSFPLQSYKQPLVQKQKITVSLSKPKNNLLVQINGLLDKYHNLKSSYLSSIHQLEEQLNFQKQQEEAEVDKINHLIAELAKKNKRIKQICQGKTQTLLEEVPEVDSPAV